MIENIVLKSNTDGSYNEYLIQYQLSDVEYEDLDAGNPVSFDLVDRTILLPLENGSFGAIVSNSSSDSSICYEFAMVVENCGSGQHHSGNMDQWANCKHAQKPVYYFTWQATTCGGTDGGSGGPITNPPSGQPGVGDLPPAGGGGSANPKPNDPNEGSPGDQGNDPPNQEEPVDEIGGVTKPLKLEIDEPKTENCIELENDTQNNNLKNYLNILKANTGGSNEFGIDIFKLPNQTAPILDGQVHVGNEMGVVYGPANTYKKGIAHNHLSNPIHKHIGTFSQNDLINIYDLIYVAIETNTNLIIEMKDIVSYLVTPEGNYALKLTDLYKIRDNFRNKYDNRGMTGGSNPDFDTDFKEKVDNFYRINKIQHGKPKDTQNLGFLKLIKEYDLGIELYEADDNFENWKKLEIDDNETGVKRTPC